MWWPDQRHSLAWKLDRNANYCTTSGLLKSETLGVGLSLPCDPVVCKFENHSFNPFFKKIHFLNKLSHHLPCFQCHFNLCNSYSTSLTVIYMSTLLVYWTSFLDILPVLKTLYALNKINFPSAEICFTYCFLFPPSKDSSVQL